METPISDDRIKELFKFDHITRLYEDGVQAFEKTSRRNRFVVRPSVGSSFSRVYVKRPITNFRLKAGLRAFFAGESI